MKPKTLRLILLAMFTADILVLSVMVNRVYALDDDVSVSSLVKEHKPFDYQKEIRDKSFIEVIIEDHRKALTLLPTTKLVEICTDTSAKYFYSLLSTYKPSSINGELRFVLIDADAEGYWMAALKEIAARNYVGVSNPRQFLIDLIAFVYQYQGIDNRSHVILSTGLIIQEAKKNLAAVRLKENKLNELSMQIPALLTWQKKGETANATHEDKMYEIGAELLLKEKIIQNPDAMREILSKIKTSKSELSSNAERTLDKIGDYVIENEDIQKDVAFIHARKKKGLPVASHPVNDNFHGP
ncbi:MAG: hypothetical protein ACE14V_10605 [bacterium]